MQTIAKVTSDGKLEIPQEILSQLEPLSEYEVILTQNEINFKKKPKITLADLKKRVEKAGKKSSQWNKSSINLDEFLEELDNLEPDFQQPTLEEISAIVKEVRQELWNK